MERNKSTENDTKVVEITIKASEVGKISLVLETKKDITKLYKKAVVKTVEYLKKELDKLDS